MENTIIVATPEQLQCLISDAVKNALQSIAPAAASPIPGAEDKLYTIGSRVLYRHSDIQAALNDGYKK